MILLLTFALSFASPGVGAHVPDTIGGEELSKLLERWSDQYIRWIITDGERDQYKAMTTDEERLLFIEQFWRRRDPTPENEYRRDYFQRFFYATKAFSAGKPGWATDRGRIYLLLGPPHSIQQNPMGRTAYERPSEIWTYNNLDIPQIPPSLDIKFVDFKGTGEFEIVSDIDTSAPVATIFGVAETPLHAWAMRRQTGGVEDLQTGGEKYGTDPTQLTMNEFDLQEQLQEIQRPERTLQPLGEVVDARVTFARLSVGVATGAQHIENGKVTVPVGLAVPYQELASQLDAEKMVFDLDYVIRLVDGEGEEAAIIQNHLVFSLTKGQYADAANHKLFIEEKLEVAPGAYKLQALIRDNEQNKIGSSERPLDVRAPAQQQALSLGNLVLARALVPATLSTASPFQFGTVRVVPVST